MWEKYNKYRVLSVFFDNPLPEGSGFQLREIGRIVRLAPMSVRLYLKELEREGLIISKKHRIHGYPIYYANMESEDFLLYKKLDTVRRIKKSGLLEYLDEKLSPECVVLFGSASRGQDIIGSDIDIYACSDEKKLVLDNFDKKLKRKINVFFSSNFSSLSEELKSNIINGIVLQGYLEAL